MNIQEFSEQLSRINNPEEWKARISHLDGKTKRQIFEKAEVMWLKRMVSEGLLFIHPDVFNELKENNWKPNDLQKRMIWASILASLEGHNSKDKFRDIKSKIIEKHGNKWWFDVYKRKTHAYAARQRILKQQKSTGPGLSMMATKSTLIAHALNEERLEALRMIPK